MKHPNRPIIIAAVIIPIVTAGLANLLWWPLPQEWVEQGDDPPSCPHCDIRVCRWIQGPDGWTWTCRLTIRFEDELPGRHRFVVWP